MQDKLQKPHFQILKEFRVQDLMSYKNRSKAKSLPPSLPQTHTHTQTNTLTKKLKESLYNCSYLRFRVFSNAALNFTRTI